MANATEMLMTHCCHCGHLISRSASGTRSIMRCPKCGAEIEVTVREKTVTNENHNGNGLYEVVREWAEQKKLR